MGRWNAFHAGLAVVYHGGKATVFPLPNFGKALNYMIISCFCDESGKFKDHKVTAFAGLALLEDSAPAFDREWRRNLYRSGLDCLTMKEALKHTRPLSPTMEALGLEARIEALMPFVECIRRHFEVIAAVATNSEAFDTAPENVKRILGPNPHYSAFTLSMMEMVSFVQDDDRPSVVCDDDEETAETVYKLYRTLRLRFTDVKRRIAAIAFADDEVFRGVQAADMVSSLIRRKAAVEFFGESFEYAALYEALCAPLGEDKLYELRTMFVDKDKFSVLASDYTELQAKYPDGDLRLAEFGKSLKLRR